MLVVFELSMPRNNAWNGRWSGDDQCYAVIKSYQSQKAVARAAEIIAKGPYWHEFGDGWAAQVDVREVNRSEAAKLRNRSKGFCGYEWMIETIVSYGRIMNTLQLNKYFEEQSKMTA